MNPRVKAGKKKEKFIQSSLSVWRVGPQQGTYPQPSFAQLNDFLWCRVARFVLSRPGFSDQPWWSSAKFTHSLLLTLVCELADATVLTRRRKFDGTMNGVPQIHSQLRSQGGGVYRDLIQCLRGTLACEVWFPVETAVYVLSDFKASC